MQTRRRSALLGITCLLTLAACGSGSGDTALPIADESPIATEPPSATVAASDDNSEQAPIPIAATEPDAAPAGAAPANEDAPEQPTVTEAPEAPSAPAEPVIGGRLFAPDVQAVAQFDANPFPDLVIDDIGKDAQVNIKNILPSDRPVLLWAWAPH